MKIAFAKVRFQEVPFEIKEQNFALKGSLASSKKNFVTLTGDFEAELELQCDRCGDVVSHHHQEYLELLIHDGIYNGSEEGLDIIESMDGFIDLDMIIESELSILQSDYFYCNTCQEKD